MDPSPEEQRLRALQSYHIIDADISEALDGLVELASNICGAPISLVNLVDATRQVTKARRGLDITEIPREDSFCQHTMMGEGVMIVEDARSDPRFKDNPLVTGDPNIRFYAGMPLTSAGGHHLGAVCLIDLEPRALSEDQQRTLRLIAGEVSARLELIKSTHTLREQNAALKKSDLFIQNSSDVQAIVEPKDGTIIEINDEALRLYECGRGDLIGHPYGRWVPKDNIREKLQQLLGQTDRPAGSLVTPITTGSGRRRYLAHSFSFHGGLWYATARDITERKQAQLRLQQSVEEKELLLAEIHHRVKNNLAIISGLLELEIYKTEQAHTRRVLENSTMRIKSMAVVHEMLYEADDFNSLNFAAFVPKVIDAIIGAHPPTEHPVTFEIDVDDISLNVNQAIPCGLIINELVTNAYQHGFGAGVGGQITVRLVETPDGICLQVSDNGAGLPPGFAPGGDSLGFTIIKTLAKQLRGEFSYATDPETTFSLRFGKRDEKGAASALPAGYASS